MLATSILSVIKKLVLSDGDLFVDCKQGLEKQLKVSIENEAIQKANHSEPKPLEMFKSSSSQRVIQKTKLPKRK